MDCLMQLTQLTIPKGSCLLCCIGCSFVLHSSKSGCCLALVYSLVWETKSYAGGQGLQLVRSTHADDSRVCWLNHSGRMSCVCAGLLVSLSGVPGLHQACMHDVNNLPACTGGMFTIALSTLYMHTSVCTDTMTYAYVHMYTRQCGYAVTPTQ